MFKRPALTLVELLIVTALLSSLTTVVFMSYNNTRINQALVVSSENLATVIQRAHIYARESKNSKAWGIKYLNNSDYELMSGSKNSPVNEMRYSLEQPTGFETLNWEVWFSQVTGDTTAPIQIVVKSPHGDRILLDVSGTGVVNSQRL